MKKFLLISVGLIILALIAFWVFKTPILSYYLSKQLKVPVSVGSIHFGKNQIEIKDFEILNPNRYQERKAFQASKIVVDYQADDLPRKIESVVITEAKMNISCDNPLCTENNWTDIVGRVAEKESKNKQDVVIGRLSFDRLTIDAEDIPIFPNRKDRLELTNLEFKNLSSQQGFPTQQLIAAIFRSAGLKDLLKDVFKKPSMFEKMIKSLQEDKFD